MTRGVRARLAGLALAGLVGTAGCGLTLSDLPRPGGAVSGPSYEITAVFADVLVLPAGARVRVGGVDVGRVVEITTENFLAQVRIRLPRSVVVTDRASAELRMTTPLGEGFIELDPGTGGTPLTDGAVLAPAATSATASIEDTLTAASLLLTGGGLGQLKTVITELNAALDSESGDLGRLLRSLTATLDAFNDRTDDIDRVLTALDGLSGTLVARRGTLLAALRDTAPAAALLADSTDRLTELLGRFEDLARVSDRVVRRTRADLVATLRELEPVLDALISISDEVAPTLRQLVRFGEFLDQATPGDYLTGDANLSESSFGGPS